MSPLVHIKIAVVEMCPVVAFDVCLCLRSFWMLTNPEVCFPNLKTSKVNEFTLQLCR